MKVKELIEQLADVPPDWEVTATRSGRSLEVWDPNGSRYAFVFTNGQSTRWLTDRRRLATAGVPPEDIKS